MPRDPITIGGASVDSSPPIAACSNRQVHARAIDPAAAPDVLSESAPGRPPARPLLYRLVMKRTLQALGSALVIQISLAACSSTSGVDDGNGGGGTTAAQGTGATTKAAGTTAATKAATQATNDAATNATTNDAVTTGSGGDCAMQPDYDTCDECFCTANEDGCDTYYELEADACLCGAGSPCEAECANACTNDVDDPACDACYESLSDDDACWEAVDAGCASDAGCSTYLTAIEACEALPD